MKHAPRWPAGPLSGTNWELVIPGRLLRVNACIFRREARSASMMPASDEPSREPMQELEDVVVIDDRVCELDERSEQLFFPGHTRAPLRGSLRNGVPASRRSANRREGQFDLGGAT